MRLIATVAALLMLVGGVSLSPIRPAPVAAAPGPAQDAPLLMVIDTSGSMGSKDSQGVHKLDSAKRSVLGVTQNVSPGVTVGVWTYPGGDSCSGGGFLSGLDMRTLDSGLRTRLTADVLALRATGDTPTAPALKAATDALSAKGFRSATVVLVSDGQSTCGGDPCDTAKEIVSSGFHLTVQSVGFELSGDGRKELECIAAATNGRYHEARNGGELIDKLADITKRSLKVSVTAPAKVIGGGMALLALSVRNDSATETATDVRVSLAFTEGTQMFRKVAPPVLRFGNLAPGKSADYTWELPVATTPDQVLAKYRVVASSASGAHGNHHGEITVVRRGAYGDVAGGVLAALLADSTSKVAVFGDSYASGEGAGTYAANTDKVDRRCHRSELTHVTQLFGAARTRNYACSGAVQQHLFAPFPTRMPTMSQVEEMSREDAIADAAFLSVGGNDMGFAGVVLACIMPNRTVAPVAGPSTMATKRVVDTECGKPDATAAGERIGDEVNTAWIAERLAALRTQLPDTYRKLYDAINVRGSVQSRGHEAPLFVLGYPKIFPEVVGIGCGEFVPREVTFANKVVERLNQVLRSSVGDAGGDGRGIYFVDAVEHAMQPSNTLCDGAESGIVGVGLLEGLTKKSGEALLGLEAAQELVHPNKGGYERIAGSIASWSSSSAAPTGVGGNHTREAPRVVTGEPRCQPLALTQTDLRLSTQPAQCITVHVYVDKPSTYWAEVHSSPIALGGGEVNPGASELRIDLPPGLTTGRHTLQVVMVSESGEVTAYAVQLTVAQPLPWWWWLIAVASAASLAAALVFAVRATLLHRRASKPNGIATNE